MTKLEQLLHEIRTETGAEFIGTHIVGVDGLSIADVTIRPDFDPTDSSARAAMIMKLAEKSSNKINAGKVLENLATTNLTYVLARFLGDGSYIWVVTVTRNATLGAVRVMMNEYMDQLWDAIPH